MGRYRLELAAGWREVQPQPSPFKLLFAETDIEGGRGLQLLKLFHTDFSSRKLIEIGGLNCPFAVDEARKVAFCSKLELDHDADPRPNEILKNARTSIVEVSLTDAKCRTVAEAPNGDTFNWLLSHDPANGKLISYLLHMWNREKVIWRKLT